MARDMHGDEKDNKPSKGEDEKKRATGDDKDLKDQDLKDQAIGDLKKRRLLAHSELYLYDGILQKGQPIFIGREKIDITRDSRLIFIDLAPLLNWGHPCEYFLFDNKKRTLYKVISANMPPKGLFKKSKAFHRFHRFEGSGAREKKEDSEGGYTSRSRGNASRTLSDLLGKKRGKKGKRYAILFSGSSNRRHLNDLEFAYRTLIERYSFHKQRVSVFNCNGNDTFIELPNSHPNDPTQQPYPGGNYTLAGVATKGTKINLGKRLKALSRRGPEKIEKDDVLFIFTTNHGGNFTGGYSEPCIICYDDDKNDFNPMDSTISVWEFADLLKLFPRFKALIVVMEQCFGGAFADAVIDSSQAEMTYFAAASRPCSSSTGCEKKPFDQLAYNLFTAMNGYDPYSKPADLNVNSPTFQEAFNYADRKKQHVHDEAGGSYIDTPNYRDKPAGCGSIHDGVDSLTYCFNFYE